MAWVPHTVHSKLYAFFLQFPISDTVTLPSVLYTPMVSFVTAWTIILYKLFSS